MERLTLAKKRVLKISEYFYLLMFALLTAYAILQYVYIDIVWSDLGIGIPALRFLVRYFLLEPQNILLMTAIVRQICAEKYNMGRVATMIVAYTLANHAVSGKYDSVLIIILLMIGAWGIPYRRIIKVYFAIGMVIVGGTLLLSQTGAIENLIYTPYGRKTRMAFGFYYPTRFAAHIFYLMLWYWFLRSHKLKYFEILLPIAGGIFVLEFSDARGSGASLFLLALVMCYHTFRVRGAKKKRKKYSMNRCLSLFLANSVTICAMLVTVITMLYERGNGLWGKIDGVFSGRLSLGSKAMHLLGFDVWSRYIRMDGGGEHLTQNPKYFTIDSAFLMFSIAYGIVMLVLLLILFWYIGVRAREQKQWILLWVMAFAAVHSTVEPHIISLNYCPLLLASFANLRKKRGVKKHDKKI